MIPRVRAMTKVPIPTSAEEDGCGSECSVKSAICTVSAQRRVPETGRKSPFVPLYGKLNFLLF
jgi:hypothetical protein